ncbi:hypothetical protein B0T22DRAFT_512975 [Podospora appendiculata]|uniref:Uncharacterized protein n=1 Tax=Podospora appendiculata TaxID=314037 RepID=A0AAE1CCT0_9PEZI|nr:hypothetical protein B0T22DRAFT_512975 [Podospora appendiculata]
MLPQNIQRPHAHHLQHGQIKRKYLLDPRAQLQRHQRVQPQIYERHAGLQPLLRASLDRYVFADTLLVGWSWLVLELRYLLTTEWLWHRREEERLVFLPGTHLTRMRDEVVAELLTATSDPRASKRAAGRSINMRNTYCCRALLAEHGAIPSASCALVTKAVFATLTFLTVGEVLAQAAQLHGRRGPRVARRAAAVCSKAERHPALFGDPRMRMMMISSWVKADLFAVDFSAAVLATSMPLENLKRANRAGRPSCLQGPGTKAYATRNMGVVIGEDARGDYWLLYTLRKQAWRGVERDLSAMGDVLG